MEGKKLSCVYLPKFDRFVVGWPGKSIGTETLISSQWYLSLEYFRYIPDSKISIEEIDRFLEKYPQELCCEITNACNFSCPICVADSRATKMTQISKELYARILEGKPRTIKRITLTGGEPTLHPYLSEMLAEASCRASGIVLSTNGSLPKKLEKALKENTNIVVAISLHGSKVQHDGFVGYKDAYERALESIQVASDYAIAIQIHTTIVPETLNGLDRLCGTLTDMPITEHRLNIVKPRGRRSVEHVPYEVLRQFIVKLKLPYKISIKKKGQPFLFVTCAGRKEMRNVRRC